MKANKIDYTKYESIGFKKINTTTNVVLANYTTAINSLYNYSEETLERVDDKLVQIESLLDLLECKLASIPGEALPDPPAVERPAAHVEQNVQGAVQSEQKEEKKEANSEEKKEADPEEEKNRAREELYADEQVMKFARMLKLGIAEPAILLKIQSLGYPDDILDVISISP
eukprot:TRINITY_DN7809_c0_g1_i2.p1 TRINITY_DN7809_c0_g1~~TRINITY_DN7809_c0_g1_i2.p1  ORF type:complete len:171 (+),score=71.51 TRINITY_DN7809_c0_g1_i2:90-602(+)